MLGKTSCGSFCYAQFLQAHAIHGKGDWGDYIVVKENAAALLRDELAVAARRPDDHKYHISRIRVFSASSTEPLAGPVFDVYRECLRVLVENTPAMWVVQTRLPRVTEIAGELAALGKRVIASITIETDDESLTPLGGGSPPAMARMRAAEALRARGIPIHVAVAPALPARDAASFATWIAEVADFATVDTAVSGDGTGAGKRTEKSQFPQWIARSGRDWRDESAARDLYHRLRTVMGNRAGWSQEGFARLADPYQGRVP